jgi:cysteine-S-conjugate beta-lyase
MRHDFDKLIDRKGTNSLSEDGYPSYLFGDAGVPRTRYSQSDLISMWVADMQFAAPQVVIDAITQRLKHPVLGYTMNLDEGLYEAFRNWCVDHYAWSFTREETQVSLGVIPALFGLVDYICGPQDKVLTLTPAYHYFELAAVKRGRLLVASDLVYRDDDCFIDFEDFERKVSDPAVKLFFLCHPHNPTGRIWTEAELRRLAQLCFSHGVKIVSDEIHCDLLRQGRTHTPLAKLFPGSRDIITCMAISKTFNLA